MGCQDGTGSEKYLMLAGLVFWFSEHKEAQQISANISARWELNGIFAYHSESRRGVAARRRRAATDKWSPHVNALRCKRALPKPQELAPFQLQNSRFAMVSQYTF
jgi:hypothetical protein